MEATEVFRIKNIKTKEYHKSYSKRTIWMSSHHPKNSFKQKFGQAVEDHPDWELLKYKLVRI